MRVGLYQKGSRLEFFRFFAAVKVRDRKTSIDNLKKFRNPSVMLCLGRFSLARNSKGAALCAKSARHDSRRAGRRSGTARGRAMAMPAAAFGCCERYDNQKNERSDALAINARSLAVGRRD